MPMVPRKNSQKINERIVKCPLYFVKRSIFPERVHMAVFPEGSASTNGWTCFFENDLSDSISTPCIFHATLKKDHFTKL
jgi:hypothetical protein